MPNWCDNRVSIHCNDKSIIKEFVDNFMTNGVLDFFKIVPLGLGNDEEGNPKWDYHAAVDKWGTKWPLSDEDADSTHIQENTIDMFFVTAWAPPEGIYNAIDEWFDERTPDFSISWFYDEPGMEFAGYLNNE